MKPRIMVYGSYAVGMTINCSKFPTPGQTVMGKNFNQLHGGKGSNQAIATARLGGDVCYVSCVGRDDLGKAALKLFKAENLDAKVKLSDKLTTGVGFVMLDEQGQNRIIIDFAASMDVTPRDIDGLTDQLKDCKILLMQLESDVDTITYAAKKAKELGVTVILDPAPFRDFPSELINFVDIITPNENEACQLLGLPPDHKIETKALGAALLEKGFKHIVVTLGEKGALFMSKDCCQIIPVPRPVEVMDTTGAGDTFAGALAVGIGEGKTYTDAVSWANMAASISVTKYGVIESIPTKETVEQYLRHN